MRTMHYVDPEERLSPNFYCYEFCRSEYAEAHGIEIRVVHGSPVHVNLVALAGDVLQPARDQVGPLYVSSGYRPAHVNAAIGGAEDSQHTTGEAADLWHEELSPLDLARVFVDTSLPIDQLILEHDQGVVHVSHVCVPPNAARNRNRGQFLTRYIDGNGDLQYLNGIIPEEELP